MTSNLYESLSSYVFITTILLKLVVKRLSFVVTISLKSAFFTLPIRHMALPYGGGRAWGGGGGGGGGVLRVLYGHYQGLR